MNWSNKKVMVTGAAGFIGSNLVDKLLEKGASVLGVDKIFTPIPPKVHELRLKRIREIYQRHGFSHLPLIVLDMASQYDSLRNAMYGCDIVFHLSAVFGGREFVETRQADCARILAIDNNTFSAAAEVGIERFFYASSACVYPPDLQREPTSPPLKETDVIDHGHGGMWWRASDNLYGWAKLMGELQCRMFHEEKRIKTSTARFLTVYGPGELDASHAIAALIERALQKKDPYEVWGSGEQERGFTYVDDIVEGIILACEKIEDGTPVNLGWDKRYKIKDVAKTIVDLVGYSPKFIFRTDKPEGPFSRALDLTRAKHLLGWEPKIDLWEGLRRTIEWHRG